MAVRVLRIALLVLLGMVVAGAALWPVQRRLIYFPDRAGVPAAATVLPGARDVTLDTSDGLRLDAWLVPPASWPRHLAVLVAPGNAGNRLGRVPLARALAGEGFTVLLMDYRGYGGNPGNPTEEGLARDVRAAREYLTGSAAFAANRVIHFGESLGAAVATELAVEYPPAALVLRSPFENLVAVGRYHYPMLPVGGLLRDRYPVAELVDRVNVPTVVIYGGSDSIVPPEQSRVVAARAAGPVRVVRVEGADHNDAVLVDGPPVIAAVVDVADRIG